MIQQHSRKKNNSVMDDLPMNVLEKIFSYINARDPISATGVNNIWLDIMKRVFKSTAVIRNKNQILPPDYSWLFICRPVSKDEFDKLVHPGVELLEFRVDQENGVVERWRRRDLKKILENIFFEINHLKEFNLIDVEIDQLIFLERPLLKESRPIIRIINRTKYEIDRDTIPSLLWESRKCFPEMLLINGTSYYGCFLNKVSMMSRSLLEGMTQVQLEGDFSHILKSDSIEDLTIFINRDVDGIVMMDDGYDDLPNVRRLAIVTWGNLNIHLNIISKLNFKNLNELVLLYSNGSDYKGCDLISSYFDTFIEDDFKLKEVIEDKNISRIDIKINSKNILTPKELISSINVDKIKTIGLHFYNIPEVVKSLKNQNNPLLEMFNAFKEKKNLLLYFHFQYTISK